MPSIRSLLLALAMLTSAVSVAGAQTADTRRWRMEHVAAWNFAVGIPTGWVVLDMPPMSAVRLTFRRDLSDDRKLMCQVTARTRSELAGMTQAQINSSLVANGAPTPQEARRELSETTGLPVEVYATSVRWVNGRPGYHYESLFELRSGTRTIYQRGFITTLYTPGRSYGVTCHSNAADRAAAERTYRENVSTILAALESVQILPPPVN